MRRASAGASLVDVLVGLVVGLVAIVVVQHAFVALDRVRRNAAAVTDAQVAAAFALDAIVTRIANAGAGWSAAGAWLATCPTDATFAATLRPLPVLITPGASAQAPDTLAIRQSYAPGAPIGAAFAAPAAAGADFDVQATLGFAAGDRIVAVSRTGACAESEVTRVATPSPGVLRISHAPIGVDLPVTSVLLGLGPAGRPSALRFDVSSATLRTTDVANGDAPVPLATNVVNLKFQYGIDSDGDGALDTWQAAQSAGPWSPATLLAASPATIARIKAIRVGLILRSDERDRELVAPYRWVLFDCESVDKAACPGRLEGTLAATAGGNYRYRVVETIVPLVNVQWNAAP